jgi:hypothetical protein
MITGFKNELKKVSLYSNVLMGLTSIHHVYGAVIYKTPWRAHVLFISIPVITITIILTRLILRAGNGTQKFLLWLYWVIILCASVLLIGVFEGLYNHVLKNSLFFSGLPEAWMHKIFPSGVYEMPNNIFFEVTGVMQGVFAVFLINGFTKLTGRIFKNRPKVYVDTKQPHPDGM